MKKTQKTRYPSIYKDNLRNTYFVDYRFRDADGKVRSKKKRGFDTPLKAHRWLNEYKTQKNIETDILSTRSFRGIAIEYVENKKPDIKQETYDGLMFKVNKFIPNTPIANFTKARANRWRLELNEAKQKNGNPYSTRYKNEVINICKAVIRYAIHHDYTNIDVTYSLKPFPKRYEDSFEYKVVSPAKFFDAWHKLPYDTWNDIYFKHLVLLAFSTGMRRAELKGLMFKNFDGNSVDVKQSITGKDRYDREKFEKLKTKSSERNIELDTFTIENLNELIKLTKQHKRYKPSALIFGFDKPLPNRTIQNKFDKMGLGIRFHDLRHSHATMLIESGIPINLVSRRLGHSNVAITLSTYTHALKNDEKVITDKLEKLMAVG